jgi:hypothetical protein
MLYQQLKGYQFGGGGESKKEHRKGNRNFQFNRDRRDPDARTFHCPTCSWRIPGSPDSIPGIYQDSW